MGEADSEYRAIVLELFMLALEPLRHEGPYDFGASDMAGRMSELGEEVTRFRDFWQAPPTDALYFHRKLGGMFMLAARLGGKWQSFPQRSIRRACSMLSAESHRPTQHRACPLKASGCE